MGYNIKKLEKMIEDLGGTFTSIDGKDPTSKTDLFNAIALNNYILIEILRELRNSEVSNK